MFERLGINWACTLLALISLVLAPSPLREYSFAHSVTVVTAADSLLRNSLLRVRFSNSRAIEVRAGQRPPTKARIRGGGDFAKEQPSCILGRTQAWPESCQAKKKRRAKGKCVTSFDRSVSDTSILDDRNQHAFSQHCKCI